MDSASKLTLRAEAADLQPVIDEIVEIAERRASLPEFRDALLKIRDGFREALESRWVDGDPESATAGQSVLRLKFAQPFLDDVAALRALDRDFDAVRRGHGGPPCEGG